MHFVEVMNLILQSSAHEFSSLLIYRLQTFLYISYMNNLFLVSNYSAIQIIAAA